MRERKLSDWPKKKLKDWQGKRRSVSQWRKLIDKGKKKLNKWPRERLSDSLGKRQRDRATCEGGNRTFSKGGDRATCQRRS